MLITLAIICFLISALIGAWRQSCIIYEKYYEINLPMAWRRGQSKIITWVITTTLSLIFAFISASWLIYELGHIYGKYSFEVNFCFCLYIRWLVSYQFGARPAKKKYQAFLRDYVNIEN